MAETALLRLNWPTLSRSLQSGPITTGVGDAMPFYEIIVASGPFGWKTFDMAMMELFDQGLITEETALLYCTNKGVVSRGIDTIKKTRGETTTDLRGLSIDVEYGKKK